ncbi:MAG: DUF2628 domain-containing protein [Pseudomonadota bacterium]
MARFAIYKKSGPGGFHDQRVVREGGNKYAFLFTGFWLMAKGLWLEALATLVFICFVAFPLLPTAPLAGFLLSFVPGIYLWLEGNNLVAARLLRRGWTLAALVEASNEDGAEMRYDAHRSSTVATPPPLPTATSRPKAQGNLKGPPAFGLDGP